MFEFELQPYVNRRIERMGVHERHFTTRLRQTNNYVDSPHLATAIQQRLRRAIDRVLDSDIPNDDRVYFTLASNRLSNNYTGWGLRAGEWRRGDQRVDEILQHLSKALNSNEQFEMDDTFQLPITQVRQPPRGSGKKRQSKPGHQHPQAFRVFKTSVLRIQNEDDLCCDRALVTAKAKVDQHPKYGSFKNGKKIQKEQALLLDRIGGSRSGLSRESVWSSLGQTTGAAARKRELRCDYQSPGLLWNQLRVCPLFHSLQHGRRAPLSSRIAMPLVSSTWVSRFRRSPPAR